MNSYEQEHDHEQEQLPEVEKDTHLYDYVHINEIINDNASSEINNELVNDETITNKLSVVLNPDATVDQILDFIQILTQLINNKLSNYLTTGEIDHNLTSTKNFLLVKLSQLNQFITKVNSTVDQAINEIETLKRQRLTDKDYYTINMSLQEISQALNYISIVQHQIDNINVRINAIVTDVKNNTELLTTVNKIATGNQLNVDSCVKQHTKLFNDFIDFQNQFIKLRSKTLDFINDTNVILNDNQFTLSNHERKLLTNEKQINNILPIIIDVNHQYDELSKIVEDNKQILSTAIESLKQKIDQHVNDQYLPFKTEMQTNIIHINDDVAALYNSLTSINEQINSIRTSINAHTDFANDNLNHLYALIESNTKEITNLKAIDLINLVNRINKNKNNLEEVTNTVNNNFPTLFDSINQINDFLVQLRRDLDDNAANDQHQFENNNRAIQLLEGNIKSIENEIIDIHNVNDQLTTDLAEAKTNISQHLSRINDLYLQFNNLETSINNVNLFHEDVKIIRNDLKEINTRAFQNDLHISGLTESLKTINNELNDLKTEVQQLAVSNENIILEKVQADVQKLDNEMFVLDNKSSIMTNSINAINGNISNLYEKVVAINQNLDDLNVSTKIMKSNITDLQIDTDGLATSLNNKHDEVIKNQIQLKASLAGSIQKNTDDIRLITDKLDAINKELFQNCNDVDVNRTNLVNLRNDLNLLMERLNETELIVNGSRMDEIDSNVNELNRILEEINKQVEAINIKINDNYLNQRLDLITGRINDLEFNTNKIALTENEPISASIWINPSNKLISIRDANKWIVINDMNNVLLSQQRLLKDFMYALTTVNENDHVEGLDVLNLGLQAVSNTYDSFYVLISKFIGEITRSRLPIDTFLLKNCGIDLDVINNDHMEFVNHDASIYPRGNLYVDERLWKYEEINNVLFAFPAPEWTSEERQRIIRIFANVYLPNVLSIIQERFNLTFNVDQMYLNGNNYYDLPVVPVMFNNSAYAPIETAKFTCFTALDEEDKKSHHVGIILTNDVLKLDKKEIIDKILYAILQTNIYKYSIEPISYLGEPFINTPIPKWFVEGLTSLIYGVDAETIYTISNNFAQHYGNGTYSKEVGYVLLKWFLKQTSMEFV